MTSEQHQNNEGNGAEMCPAMLSGLVVFAKVDSDQSCSRFLSDELIIQGPHFPERAGKPPYLSLLWKYWRKINVVCSSLRSKRFRSIGNAFYAGEFARKSL